MKTLVFDILICWKRLGTNHKQVLWLYLNLHVQCFELKMQFAMSEIKDKQWNIEEYTIFNTSPKFPCVF